MIWRKSRSRHDRMIRGTGRVEAGSDTMKDLLVNLIGAVVFSVNGYIAAARKGKSRIAVKFIPRVNPSEENEEASP